MNQQRWVIQYSSIYHTARLFDWGWLFPFKLEMLVNFRFFLIVLTSDRSTFLRFTWTVYARVKMILTSFDIRFFGENPKLLTCFFRLFDEAPAGWVKRCRQNQQGNTSQNKFFFFSQKYFFVVDLIFSFFNSIDFFRFDYTRFFLCRSRSIFIIQTVLKISFFSLIFFCIFWSDWSFFIYLKIIIDGIRPIDFS